MTAPALLHPPMGETVAACRAVLIGGARVLEQVGLCQGQGSDLTGQLSAVSALHVAADGDWFLAEAATQVLESWLDRHGHLTTVDRWNDAPERTVDDVVATLRAAAAALAPEPAPPAMTPPSSAARS